MGKEESRYDLHKEQVADEKQHVSHVTPTPTSL